MAEGFTLYQTHCANCHQTDGKGLGNLYPALSKAYLKDKSQVICWIKQGVNIPMTVNGRVFHRAMPSNPALKELELAELTTYLYNTWGDETTLTPIDSVKVALEKCEISLQKPYASGVLFGAILQSHD
ncbi:MAG: cytochrome c [Spirosomaceae bacterium]|nr:cytochrome c [Spirosomataceae bacterium]